MIRFRLRLFRFIAGFVATLAVLTQATPSRAGITLTFSGSRENASNSYNLAAEAQFSVIGTDLVVLLKNMATGKSVAPEDVLTAVYFNIAGNPSLTFSAAEVASDSSLIDSRAILPLASTTDLRLPETNGGWDFSNATSAEYPQKYGLGTAGLDRFKGGNKNQVGVSKGTGGPSNYGIIQSGYANLTGYLKNTPGTPLVQNQIRFVLSGLPSGFSLSGSSITDVRFQYGSETNKPRFNGVQVAAVPEPSTWIAAATAGLATIGLGRLRRKAGLA